MDRSRRYIFAATGITLTIGLSVALTRPSHSAGGAVPVQVTGTVSVRDTDNAAQQPFANSAYFTARPTSTDFLLNFTVPPGRRLVIQGMSLSLNNMGASEHPQVAFHLQTNGISNDQIVALPTLLDSFNGRADFILPQQAVTFYADAGSQVSIEVAGIGTTSTPSR